MAVPDLLAVDKPASAIYHLGGALIVVLSVICMGEVLRFGRYGSVLLGISVGADPPGNDQRPCVSRDARRHRRQEPIACLGASAAAVRARAAVFVLIRMLVALVGADLAGCPARFQLRLNDIPLGLSLPGQHARRRGTCVRAVEIQTDAAAKHIQLFLSQTRIGARDAALVAFDTRLDTIDEPVEVLDRLRVLGEQFLGDHISTGFRGRIRLPVER